MAALSDDIKLLIVVLILLFAPSMVEATFQKVEQHEREQLEVSSGNNKPSRTTPATNEGDRDGTARERSQRPERVIAFTFTRTK